MLQYAVLVALAVVCAANDAPYNPPAYKPAPYKPAAYKQEYDVPAYYNFDWAVKDVPSYNNFGQSESRNGDKTEGSYFVALPDGRIQTVKYYVDGYSGLVADVSYSGEPKYEASYNKPVYKPAPAAYKPAPAYKPTPAYQPTLAYAPAPYQA